MDVKNELYYQDAYRREFDATVLSCEPGRKGFDVHLSQTSFYPEGGGQPGDHGFLNQSEVTDTRRKNGVILHVCRQPLAVGETVHGVIDWNRRFDLMQQHSGEHIFSGIVHSLFGYDNIGFHLGDETITLDFSGPLTWEDLRTVETRANELIWRNEPVEVLYPDETELEAMEYRSKKELTGIVRIISIKDGDVCACCGTHVHTTGEIGLIKVLSTANRKDGTRCEIVCGSRALAYVQQVTDQNLAISHLLSAKVLETASAVERLQKEMLDSSYRLRGIILHQLEEKLPEIPEGAPLYTVFTEGIDTQELRKFLNRAVEEKKTGIAAGFTAGVKGTQYVILSPVNDLRPLSRALNEAFAGQGGGKPDQIQGSLHGEPAALEAFLQNWINKKSC